jgi:hypothetical protein
VAQLYRGNETVSFVKPLVTVNYDNAVVVVVDDNNSVYLFIYAVA